MNKLKRNENFEPNNIEHLFGEPKTTSKKALEGSSEFVEIRLRIQPVKVTWGAPLAHSVV